MKHICFLLLFLGTMSFAQNEEIIKVNVDGYKYRMGDNYLQNSELNDILVLNETAHRLFYDARQYRGISQVMGFAGGFLIGYQLGNLITGKEFNVLQGSIGAGLIGIAIPINIAQNKKIDRAVDIYNDGLSESSTVPMELSLTTSGTGLGFSITF
ncbi:MAG: hypothetical protein ACSHWW_11025 [Nonlabens sp.]|uniref:hypothetical protein n=1 Tax=Nonlabens sp. TaxID=1888209 RepID=UPI003EF33B89